MTLHQTARPAKGIDLWRVSTDRRSAIAENLPYGLRAAVSPAGGLEARKDLVVEVRGGDVRLQLRLTPLGAEVSPQIDDDILRRAAAFLQGVIEALGDEAA